MEPIAKQRRDHSKIAPATELPNLLAIQIDSYNDFLQQDVPPEKRQKKGLQAVFSDIFPISDVHENFTLEFVEYILGEPKYSVKECQERDMTFAIPIKCKLRLIIREDTEEGKKIKDIIEQVVYLGELPLITEKATFVINGAERVIVSQLHRSPGVFFDEETHPNGKRLYSARIIPYRGAWVEFTLDINDIMYVHIDRKRKLPVSILLRAIGYPNDEDIYALFFELQDVSSQKLNPTLTDRIVAAPVVDQESGEVVVESGESLTEEVLETLSSRNGNLSDIKLLKLAEQDDPTVLLNTLKKDPTGSEEEALFRIYSLLRPGDPPNVETAKALLERYFFNPRRYDLGTVGRHRLNQKLNLDIPLEVTILQPQDFVAIIGYLLALRNGQGDTDDIDHLGNRRVRSVGELLAQQFSIGLSRMARTIRERISLQDMNSITPQDLVNARTVSSVIASFFGSSQLSQFLEQTNPLAELAHKRRLSSLGPGGLDRAHASFEVRDVHHTHYGRICPIETPEGPNIGLIAYLSTYARVNEFGFLETPYLKVKNGRVTNQIEFLTADQEDRYTIAQADVPRDEQGRFLDCDIKARKMGDFPVVKAEEIDYIDVAPMQLVGVSAALIPFLEHDDANRALMGSNMQRQAVPLVRTEAPLVGTGLEAKVAIDSGTVIVAKRAGTVISVSADTIVVQPNQQELKTRSPFLEPVDTYYLTKFHKSNQETCISHCPIVSVGDLVERGQPLADGPATNNGELALGLNVLVAFMPWEGYNYEDAIVVSERLVKYDLFSSIHIIEFELEVRDTKAGVEELTREIPNVSEEAVRNLDENGIVRVGAEIDSGDILVGKVTPKGERELSPEERLLRAIFGEKAGEVRDASLKAPPGMSGIIIDTKIFSRKDRTASTKEQEHRQIEELKEKHGHRVEKIREIRDTTLHKLLLGHKTVQLCSSDHTVVVEAGRKYTQTLLSQLDFDQLAKNQVWTEDEEINQCLVTIYEDYEQTLAIMERQLEREIEKTIRGDELAPGVVQLVKVYVAKKRKLSVGDKMAGRHGNKGVVSKIVPEEDMPYMPDGTPVDIVLNPLGVPSRMNLGQILETHLGWAAHKLGIAVSTPVFAGATLEEIRALLEKADLPLTGKSILYDGRTGEPFAKEVTVGYIYMMKLSHLVDDKIHARSIGPYSLVTQQPLGGKAQFGGQRFGEMEVWALQAYGAAHALREMLTVKSDDVVGRSRIYEAIVKGENPSEPGIPESFNVLAKELQSLCLDVSLEE